LLDRDVKYLINVARVTLSLSNGWEQGDFRQAIRSGWDIAVPSLCPSQRLTAQSEALRSPEHPPCTFPRHQKQAGKAVGASLALLH